MISVLFLALIVPSATDAQAGSLPSTCDQQFCAHYIIACTSRCACDVATCGCCMDCIDCIGDVFEDCCDCFGDKCGLGVAYPFLNGRHHSKYTVSAYNNIAPVNGQQRSKHDVSGSDNVASYSGGATRSTLYFFFLVLVCCRLLALVVFTRNKVKKKMII